MRETHGSETRRRSQRTRDPLSDLTNTPSSAAVAAAATPKIHLSDPERSSFSTRRVQFSGPELRADESFAEITSGTKEIADGASATPDKTERSIVYTSRHKVGRKGEEKATASIADEDAAIPDKAERSVVYTSGNNARRKGKENAVTGSIASSCPPIGRIRNLDGYLNVESSKVDLLKEVSVPYRHNKKKRRHTMPAAVLEPLLPQDFVEKQKAYFAEVDAFELPEEVASKSDSG